MNPRRVLFGANTNVLYTNNVSVNTSTASSQLNGSFFRVEEETINTKLANAEISMMFSSPNANASMAETPGKPLLASSFKQPMFSTSRKNSAIDGGSSFAIHDENKIEPGGLNFSIYQEDSNESADANKNTDENKLEPGGLNFSIYQEESNESADANESTTDDKRCGMSNGLSFAIHDENKQEPGGLKFSIFQDDVQPAITSGNSGEDTA
eukprot:CAMPEP_0172324906 /NCGR_PEP_ID=MMETSP1058-20130122/52623_1 /TAXON_ID=83371 /ORGANISM="Detonula confervacea, Strain CCMP 353" /LENGTH=209 /DNA_ID=CAMNT_0013041321 /DNA_START=17 /DNA_END=642 /DNA_ORIENTATION=-